MGNGLKLDRSSHVVKPVCVLPSAKYQVVADAAATRAGESTAKSAKSAARHSSERFIATPSEFQFITYSHTAHVSAPPSATTVGAAACSSSRNICCCTVWPDGFG